MNKSLITAKDFPSHKLSVKDSNGNWKCFYISQEHSDALRAGINSPERFIVLGKQIDPKGSFYPKEGARLESLTSEEINVLRSRYMHSPEMEKKREEEKDRREQELKVATTEWIENNPDEFKKLIKQASDDIDKLPPESVFHAMSEKNRAIMVQSKARMLVRNKFLNQNKDESK